MTTADIVVTLCAIVVAVTTVYVGQRILQERHRTPRDRRRDDDKKRWRE